jgi:hypothetical protein
MNAARSLARAAHRPWIEGTDVRRASLCIVIDREPDVRLRDYVEDHLGLLLAWVDERSVPRGARRTSELLNLEPRA